MKTDKIYKSDMLKLQADNFLSYETSHYECNYHAHEATDFEMVYVENGSALHNLNGTTTRINAGDFFLIDQGSFHSFDDTFQKPISVIMVSFNASFIVPLPRHSFFDDVVSALFHSRDERLLCIKNHVFHDDEEHSVRELFRRIRLEYETSPIGYREIAKANIISIIVAMARTATSTSCQTGSVDAATYIADYINAHYTEKIRLEDLTEQLMFSHSSLSRLFQKIYGCSFTTYIQQKRILLACHMLAEGNETIESISTAVGYSDTKTFRDLFKRYMKLTPRQFREIRRLTQTCPDKRRCRPNNLFETCPHEDYCWGPYLRIRE